MQNAGQYQHQQQPWGFNQTIGGIQHVQQQANQHLQTCATPRQYNTTMQSTPSPMQYQQHQYGHRQRRHTVYAGRRAAQPYCQQLTPPPYNGSAYSPYIPPSTPASLSTHPNFMHYGIVQNYGAQPGPTSTMHQNADPAHLAAQRELEAARRHIEWLESTRRLTIQQWSEAQGAQQDHMRARRRPHARHKGHKQDENTPATGGANMREHKKMRSNSKRRRRSKSRRRKSRERRNIIDDFALKLFMADLGVRGRHFAKADISDAYTRRASARESRATCTCPRPARSTTTTAPRKSLSL